MESNHIQIIKEHSHSFKGGRLVKKAIAGLIINAFLYLFLYIGQILIIRGLSRQEYSIFVVSISFVSLASLLADLGLTSLLMKMFAEAEEQSHYSGREDERGKILGTMLVFRGYMCLLVGLFIFIVPPILGYDEKTTSIMQILIITVFISSRLLTFRNVAESFAMGRGKYNLSSAFALFDSFVFATAIFVWYQKGITIYSGAWIYALSNLPGFILLAFILARWSIRESIHIRFSFSILSKSFRHALPLILGTAFLTIFNNLDQLLLDRWSNPIQVSSFGASLRIMTVLTLLPMVLVNIVAPEVTKRLVRNEHIQTHAIVDIVLRALLFCAGAIALIIMASARSLTVLILGKEYLDAYILITYLGWLFIPLAFSTFIIEIGIAGGSLWGAAIFRFLLMVVTFAGDVLLIRSYGAEGVLIARTAALLIGAACLIFLMKNFIAVNEKPFYKFLLRFVVCLVLSSAVVITCQKMQISEILTIIFVLCLYIVFMILTKAITKYDFYQVISSLNTKK